MRRVVTFGLAITVLCCLFAMSAMATPDVPYAHYDAWFQSDTQGAAGIYRCSCNPVNNTLTTTARVQYEDALGQANWTSVASDGGDNIKQCAFVITSPAETYASYVEANFTARCSTGFTVYIPDYASR